MSGVFPDYKKRGQKEGIEEKGSVEMRPQSGSFELFKEVFDRLGRGFHPFLDGLTRSLQTT